MKKMGGQKRTLFFKVRMSDSELQELKKLKDQSTEHSISHYARKILLQKPVMIRYRNSSADEFLQEMKELKKELNSIGDNFNQAVHKLHMLGTIPEFRAWIRDHELLQQEVNRKVQDINSKVIQLYEQWLQK